MSNIASPGSGGLELIKRIEALEKNMEYEEFQVTIPSGISTIVAKGYKKNGIAVIDITLRKGTVGSITFTIPEKFQSKGAIEGSFSVLGTGADVGKLAGLQIDGTSGFVWLISALESTCHASIVYPV